MQAFPVGIDRGQIVGDIALDGDVPVGASDIDLRDDLTDHGAERHAFPAQRHFAGFELRQIEELLDQAAQPFGLRQHHLEGLGVGLLHAVEQVLQMGSDRRDRRLQLVGRGRDRAGTAA